MKLKELETMFYLKQLFDDDGGADGGSGGDDGSGEEGSEGSGGEKKYTDEDLDRIINKKFAEWQKKQEKAVKEAERLASMSAQEKAEHERDSWEQKYNDLLAENTRATLTAQATKLLADDGISGLSDTIIGALVTDSADTTKENIKSFSKAFKAAVQEAVKNANRKTTPKTGSSSGTMTKEDIRKVKDVKLRQQLIRENIDLFR